MPGPTTAEKARFDREQRSEQKQLEGENRKEQGRRGLGVIYGAVLLTVVGARVWNRDPDILLSCLLYTIGLMSLVLFLHALWRDR